MFLQRIYSLKNTSQGQPSENKWGFDSMGSVFKRMLKQLNQQDELVMNSAKQVAEVMNIHYLPDEQSPLEEDYLAQGHKTQRPQEEQL